MDEDKVVMRMVALLAASITVGASADKGRGAARLAEKVKEVAREYETFVEEMLTED